MLTDQNNHEIAIYNDVSTSYDVVNLTTSYKITSTQFIDTTTSTYIIRVNGNHIMKMGMRRQFWRSIAFE